MPMSKDPEARKRSLANLKVGRSPAPLGTTRSATHFATAKRCDPPGTEARAAEIAAVVPVRDNEGNLHPADVEQVRLAARSLEIVDLLVQALDKRGLTSPGGNKVRPELAHLLREYARPRTRTHVRVVTGTS